MDCHNSRYRLRDGEDIYCGCNQGRPIEFKCLFCGVKYCMSCYEQHNCRIDNKISIDKVMEDEKVIVDDENKDIPQLINKIHTFSIEEERNQMEQFVSREAKLIADYHQLRISKLEEQNKDLDHANIELKSKMLSLEQQYKKDIEANQNNEQLFKLAEQHERELEQYDVKIKQLEKDNKSLLDQINVMTDKEKESLITPRKPIKKTREKI